MSREKKKRNRNQLTLAEWALRAGGLDIENENVQKAWWNNLDPMYFRLPMQEIERDGVTAIIYLGSLKEGGESEVNALMGWRAMNNSERNYTMKAYWHMRALNGSVAVQPN